MQRDLHYLAIGWVMQVFGIRMIRIQHISVFLLVIIAQRLDSKVILIPKVRKKHEQAD